MSNTTCGVTDCLHEFNQFHASPTPLHEKAEGWRQILFSKLVPGGYVRIDESKA